MAMLFGTPQGRLSGGYKASLVARVHMRLGNWRKSVMPSEVSVNLAICRLYYVIAASVLVTEPLHLHAQHLCIIVYGTWENKCFLQGVLCEAAERCPR